MGVWATPRALTGGVWQIVGPNLLQLCFLAHWPTINLFSDVASFVGFDGRHKRFKHAFDLAERAAGRPKLEGKDY